MKRSKKGQVSARNDGNRVYIGMPKEAAELLRTLLFKCVAGRAFFESEASNIAWALEGAGVDCAPMAIPPEPLLLDKTEQPHRCAWCSIRWFGGHVISYGSKDFCSQQCYLAYG